MSDAVVVALIGSFTTVVCTFGAILVERRLGRRGTSRHPKPTESPQAPTRPSVDGPRNPPSRTRASALARIAQLLALVLLAIALGGILGWKETSTRRQVFLPFLGWGLITSVTAGIMIHGFVAGHRRSGALATASILEAIACSAASTTTYYFTAFGAGAGSRPDSDRTTELEAWHAIAEQRLLHYTEDMGFGTLLVALGVSVAAILLGFVAAWFARGTRKPSTTT